MTGESRFLCAAIEDGGLNRAGTLVTGFLLLIPGQGSLNRVQWLSYSLSTGSQ